MLNNIRIWLASSIVALSLFVSSEVTAAEVLARVNGETVTQADLDFLAMSRRIPQDRVNTVRDRLLEILVERELMGWVLKSRGVEIDAKELDSRIARLKQSLKESGEEPDAVLNRIGMDEERLRSELALPLMWQAYLGVIVSPERIQKFFREHKSQFDGTKLRGRQVFRKVARTAADDEIATTQQELVDIKQRIEAGSLTFADAVRQHSDAVSKESGGDVGWFGWRGGLPASVSEAAFALEGEAVSDPIRSPFGWHLIQITDRKPGEISLEDARPIVLNALSQELWKEMVAQEREKAKIEYLEPSR